MKSLVGNVIVCIHDFAVNRSNFERLLSVPTSLIASCSSWMLYFTVLLYVDYKL